MAKRKPGLRGTLVFPARGTSSDVDKSIADATDEIKETVYKSVAGLEVELNKTASVTANGTLVVEPSDGKDVMEKATVTVAVPLEDNKAATIDVSQYVSAVEVTPTDGKTAMKKTTVTLSNIPSGGDLEDNKAATIDVSAYTDPVEVTPTQGKDGMKKVTVSLSNIPEGASMIYAWLIEGSEDYLYFNNSISPQSIADYNTWKELSSYGGLQILDVDEPLSSTLTRTSDTEFIITDGGGPTKYIRDPTKDVEVWNAPPEVETTKQATIDVSTYDPAHKPVITPTAGKQSMDSVEVTLSNIPGGVTQLYAWKCDTGGGLYHMCYTCVANPSTSSALYIGNDGGDNGVIQIKGEIIEVGEGTITVNNTSVGTDVYTRSTEDDITFQD